MRVLNRALRGPGASRDRIRNRRRQSDGEEDDRRDETADDARASIWTGARQESGRLDRGKGALRQALDRGRPRRGRTKPTSWHLGQGGWTGGCQKGTCKRVEAGAAVFGVPSGEVSHRQSDAHGRVQGCGSVRRRGTEDIESHDGSPEAYASTQHIGEAGGGSKVRNLWWEGEGSHQAEH